jgi:acetylornithine deacetylase/succinyl-diaminopimelate desuccinylase-like protein
LMHQAPPCSMDASNPFVSNAAKAMEDVFGVPTAFIRCGGSIPIVSLFEQELGSPSVLPGFGLPDDRIHAPNEKLSISNYLRGVESIIGYFERVGKSSPVPSPSG